MFDAPKHKEITQGTIFSCARSENYNARDVLGLVITARCDAAQDKVPVFSYVPVVPLAKWVLVDGAALALDRAEADCLNTMKDVLEKSQLSCSLLRSHAPEAIYAAHFAQRAEERGFAKTVQRFRASMSRLSAIRALQEDKSDEAALKSLLRELETFVDSVLKELSGHRLTGYYLLRDLQTYEGAPGNYVALLREVHHIPSSVARQIAVGLAATEWADGRGDCPKFHAQDDVALPIAKLRSPWIEHLMQNFAMLFSRIGVADNKFEEVKASISL